MSPGKVLAAVIGGLVGLMAAGLIAGGIGMLWAYGTQRTVDGFFTSSAIELSTASYAMTLNEVDLGSNPGDWFPSGRLATVRIDLDPIGDTPVFVGVGAQADVNAFLEGVASTEVTWLGPNRGDVSYRPIEGGAPPSLPTDETFWVSSSAGSGLQRLPGPERGEWAIVIMMLTPLRA